MKRISLNRAFTLVEMLVVIVIIVLLTGIIMTNLVSSRSKARDAKRVSDLSQIQLALELYYDRCKQYPTPLSGNAVNPTANNNCPSGISLQSYISQIPVPPIGTQYDYYTNGGWTDYVLHVQLENSSDVLRDSLQTGNYGATCGQATKDYCLGPK